jgi:hypothetical protein
LGLLIGATAAQAQEFFVHPYLQQMTPTSVWVLWETSSGSDSQVAWGPTANLGQTAQGTSFLNAGGRIHEVLLRDLEPDRTYHYQVRTGNAQSAVQTFHTPHAQAAEAPLRFAVLSDMQRDHRHPEVYRDLLDQGVVPFCRAEEGTELPEALSMVLIPGDLVDNGLNVGQWRNEFFADGRNLMGRVPFYPVLGNHEHNTPYYFNYFHLPENGTEGDEEHWWWFDQSNVRFIGLDSNTGFRTPRQLTWLSGVLDDACTDAGLDFVFAQLHHPHHSELWIAGNTDYTGEVIALLEQFSSQCGKPSVHFYGHTHGYSRGQSLAHNHTMINAASGGGALDRWGEYAQVDYPEYSVSTDDYGFVHVSVEAGDDPKFRIRRLSWGVPEAPQSNELSDRLEVRRNNDAPVQPRPWRAEGPVSPNCFTLVASSFEDPDGDEHGASQWQVADTCDAFSTPLIDRWQQYENRFNGEDRQAGIDLTREQVEVLDPNRSYCWRVRYRDKSLGWSAWSDPEVVQTGPRMGTGNLLVNGDAEQGTTGWIAVDGPLEALTAGECNGVEPYEGERYFVIGGLCEDEAAFGEARQRVDVSAYAEVIDRGERLAELVAYLRDFDGSDEVSVGLVFHDAQGDELSRSTPQTSRLGRWTRVVDAPEVPAGTRQIDVVMTGTRHAGTDNDSYADALSLRLRPASEAPCDEPSQAPPGVDAGPAPDAGSPVVPERDAGPALDASPVVPPAPAEGCSCSSSVSSFGWFAVALLWGRRRFGA